MSMMVEKAARAMCAAADDDWDWSGFYIVDAKDTVETGRDVYRSMARAAIEAMKEPTHKMEDASYLNSWEANEVWGDMIQAALEEGQ